MEMYHIPTVVIGGGVVGLLIARELSNSYPEMEIALLEKEPFFGDHTTGRNSGVLHAGIYYQTGSLKHRLCLQGVKMWNELSQQLDFRINNCGKYIVATCDEELPAIEKLYQKAKDNEVPGICWADEMKVAELSKYIRCKKAFYSPTTSIIDTTAALKNIETELFNKEIPLMLDTCVEKVERDGDKFIISVAGDQFSCDTLINAAGLFAVDIRKQLGLTNAKNVFVKGNYLKTSQSIYTETLLYPVPPEKLGVLGVHSSFDLDGVTRFGPNARQLEDSEELNYNPDQNLLESMYPAIERIFHNVEKDKLSDDFSGIRPRVKVDGEVVTDFWIKGEKELGIPGYIELLGIESPGLTAAPAIAQYVVSCLT